MLPHARPPLRSPSALSLAERKGTYKYSQFHKSKQRDRLLACAASHRSGNCSRSPKDRTSPCSLSPRSPCLPEIPTEGRALEGKPAQLCRALRKLTANQAAQTQPACSQRGEATLGSRSVGLAQTHHVGEKGHLHACKGKPGNKRRGPSQHSLEGGAKVTPGPPATTSGLPGTWKGLIQRLPPGRLSEPSSVC